MCQALFTPNEKTKQNKYKTEAAERNWRTKGRRTKLRDLSSLS